MAEQMIDQAFQDRTEELWKRNFFYVNSVVYLGNPYGNYFIDIIEYKTVYSIRDTAENNAIRKILTTLPSSQNSDGGCCCILLYEVTDNATWYLLYFGCG